MTPLSWAVSCGASDCSLLGLGDLGLQAPRCRDQVEIKVCSAEGKGGMVDEESFETWMI